MPPSIPVMTDNLSTMNNINTSAATERADNNQRDKVAAPVPVDYTADAPSDNSRDNSPHPESKQSSPVIQNGSIDTDEEEDVANRDANHDNIPTAYFLPRGKLTKPSVVVQPPKSGGK